MDKIIIWGATGQAIVMEELLSHYNIKIEALFDNDMSVDSPIPRVPIYYKKSGFKKWLSGVENKKDYYFIIAIGGNNGSVRRKLGKMLESEGLNPYTAIHPSAFVAKNVIIGKGVQILANSSICAKACLNDFVIINTSASIDHECFIGSGVHIGPGAKLAGCINVGHNTFIGTNATILPRKKIGTNTIIGAGSVVTKNIPDNVVAYGNPCNILRNNNFD